MLLNIILDPKKWLGSSLLPFVQLSIAGANPFSSTHFPGQFPSSASGTFKGCSKGANGEGPPHLCLRMASAS